MLSTCIIYNSWEAVAMAEVAEVRHIRQGEAWDFVDLHMGMLGVMLSGLKW